MNRRVAFTVAVCGMWLSGCAGGGDDKRVLRVGVTPVPAGEVLAEVIPILAKQGIAVKAISFTDYMQPNLALAAGDLDANLYQNIPFLEQFNRDRGSHLVAVKKVYLPPMGIYAGRSKSLASLNNRAIVAIPNDPVNLGRALLLLQEAGVIRLQTKDAASHSTVQDIRQNSHRIQVRELEAAQLPRSLPDVDVAVINANYALDAGLNPMTDALFHESQGARYVNVLAANRGMESDPRIQALAAALTSPHVKTFLQARYRGAVIPSF